MENPGTTELVAGAVSYTTGLLDSEYKIYPHGPIEPLLPSLWRVVGSLPPPLRFPRNMFIHRLPDGTLLLDSVVAMNEEGMAGLEALGRPAIMIIPHPKHAMDAGFYQRRYPFMRLYAAPDTQAKHPELRYAGTPEVGLAPLGIKTRQVPGLDVMEEVLELQLDGGRVLLFADLVNQNPPDVGLLMRIFGGPDGGGVPRILKWTQIRDKEQVRCFLWELAALPSLRMVAGCHGSVVQYECADFLAHSAASL